MSKTPRVPENMILVDSEQWLDTMNKVIRLENRVLEVLNANNELVEENRSLRKSGKTIHAHDHECEYKEIMNARNTTIANLEQKIEKLEAQIIRLSPQTSNL